MILSVRFWSLPCVCPDCLELEFSFLPLQQAQRLESFVMEGVLHGVRAVGEILSGAIVSCPRGASGRIFALPVKLTISATKVDAPVARTAIFSSATICFVPVNAQIIPASAECRPADTMLPPVYSAVSFGKTFD